MRRPGYIDLPVRVARAPDGAFFALFSKNEHEIAKGLTISEAEWLAALINYTADATPADPDAGLSDKAKAAVAKIRELDATPHHWKMRVSFESVMSVDGRIGGREGGAA